MECTSGDCLSRCQEGVSLLTMKDVQMMSDSQLQPLLAWVDQAPITRDKKNLARDMSDAVPVAEIIKYFLPKVIELHSYETANSARVKEQNWFLLSRKVLCKLGFELDADVMHNLARGTPWVIETLLQTLKDHIDRYFYISPAMSSCQPDDNDSPDREALVIAMKALSDRHYREIQEQKKAIESLTTKILKMEHVSHLKDIRIKDLTKRLEKAGLLHADDHNQQQQHQTIAVRRLQDSSDNDDDDDDNDIED